MSDQSGREGPLEAYFLEKLHILSTHPGLAEFKKSMRGRRIVEDDVKDLLAEKIGQAIATFVTTWVLPGHGKRGRRRVLHPVMVDRIRGSAILLHQLLVACAIQ